MRVQGCHCHARQSPATPQSQWPSCAQLINELYASELELHSDACMQSISRLDLPTSHVHVRRPVPSLACFKLLTGSNCRTDPVNNYTRTRITQAVVGLRAGHHIVDFGPSSLPSSNAVQTKRPRSPNVKVLKPGAH
jgi:hypothetical protein